MVGSCSGAWWVRTVSAVRARWRASWLGGERGVAGFAGFEDALVFFSGNRERARHAFDVEPAVSIGVIVQLANRAHQAVAGMGDEREVKLAIDGLPLAQVVAGECLHAAKAVAQRIDVALGESRHR